LKRREEGAGGEGEEGGGRGRRKGEGIIIPSFLFLIVFVDAFVIGVIIIGLHGRMDEEFLRSRKRRRRRRKNRGTFFSITSGKKKKNGGGDGGEWEDDARRGGGLEGDCEERWFVAECAGGRW
jgi:hypothetical protein